jgi:hypothetical protein
VAATTTGERIICPVCFSTNQAYGLCASCGAKIEEPPPEPDTSTVKGKAEKAVKVVQKKTGLTKKQLIIAAAILGPLLLMTVLMLPKPAAVPPPGTSTDTGNPELDKLGVKTPVVHESSDKATVLASKSAGFKVTPIPDWWYEDTTELTKPAPSFGAYSERTNQKLLFVKFDDMSPVANITAFAGKPPYIADNVVLTAVQSENILDHGEQVIGDGTIKWVMDKCLDKDGNEVRVFLGGFPAMEKGKSFLVVGQKYDPKATAGFDYQIALATIDQLAADRTEKGNQQKLSGDTADTSTDTGTGATASAGGDADDEEDAPRKKAATAEDMQAFFDTVKDKVKSNLELPEWAQEEMKKDKESRKKWKVRLTVGVDHQGNLKRLEKQEIPDEDIEKICTALENAITGSAPFKDVPGFKGQELQFVVKLSGAKVKVEKPSL